MKYTVEVRRLTTTIVQVEVEADCMYSAEKQALLDVDSIYEQNQHNVKQQHCSWWVNTSLPKIEETK